MPILARVPRMLFAAKRQMEATMTARLPPIVRSVAGILIGYVIFVLGAWFVQEVLLGGVSYYDDLTTIVMAGLLTPVSAAIGAVVTAAIAGRRPWLHIMPMVLLIAIETSFLYSKGLVDGPLWFEAAAGSSLIAGAAAGVLVWQLAMRRGWAPSF
jgi:hypothetical protein